MIHSFVQDKIDDIVFELRAKNTKQSSPIVEDITPFFRVSRPTRQDTVVSFSAKKRKHASAVFSLSTIVEESIKRGAPDLYVGSLAFRFREGEGTRVDEKRVYFENIAPTDRDTEDFIKRLRLKYLHRHGKTSIPPGEICRMLRFKEVRSRDNKRLDTNEVYTPEFIQWLSEKTHGLVMELEEDEVRRIDFAGRGYSLPENCVWRSFLEE
jgi:hypothetical protein